MKQRIFQVTILSLFFSLFFNTSPLVAATDGACYVDSESYVFRVHDESYQLRYEIEIGEARVNTQTRDNGENASNSRGGRQSTGSNNGRGRVPSGGRVPSATKKLEHYIKLHISDKERKFMYKGFDVTRFLMKDLRVKVEFELRDKSNSKVEKRVFNYRLNSLHEVAEWWYVYDAKSNLAACPVKVKNVRFEFADNERDIEKVYDLMDEYANTLEQVNDYITELDRIEDGRITNIDKQVDFFQELQDELPAIKEKSFRGIPAIPAESLVERIAKLDNELRYARRSLPNKFYQEGLRYRKSNPSRARDYFEAALAVDPNYSEALAGLGESYLRENDWDGFEDVLSDLARKDDPRGEILAEQAFDYFKAQGDDLLRHPTEFEAALVIYRQAGDILCPTGFLSNCRDRIRRQEQRALNIIGDRKHFMYEDMLRIAVSDAQGRRFDNSLRLLAEAMLFQRNNRNWIPDNLAAVRAFQDIYCIRIDQALYAQNGNNLQIRKGELLSAKNMEIELADYIGMVDLRCANRLQDGFENLYSSYISAGDQATRRGDFKNAIYSLDEASKLSKERLVRTDNRQLDDAYGNAYRGMYTNKVEQGRTAFLNKRFGDATKAYEEANRLCQSKPQIGCETRLYNSLYESYFMYGKQLQQRGDNRKAVIQYQNAEDLALSHTLEKGNYRALEIKNAIRDAGGKVIGSDIHEANKAIKDNELDKAEAIKEDINRKQADYHLQDSPIIDQKVGEIQEGINTQTCINNRNNFKSGVEIGMRASKNKEFFRAFEQLKEMTDKYYPSQCEGMFAINDHASREMKRIEKAYQYEKKIRKMEDLISKTSYYSAGKAYEEALSYFNLHQIGSTFGIEKPDLYTMMIKSNDIELKAFGANYFRKKGENDHTIALLHDLSRRSMSNKMTKALFTRLGTELAVTDVRKYVGGDYKSLLSQYRLESAGLAYKKFKKAYKKIWKKAGR